VSLAKFTIHQHRPFRCIAMIAIAVAATFFVQRYSYLTAIQSYSALSQELQQFDEQNKKLQTENETLNDSFSKFSNETDIQKYELDTQQATILSLEQQVSILQEQTTVLNKELMFYQTLTQGERPNKLQIRELQLHADANDTNIVQYRLVVTQGRKVNQALTGTIEMTLNSSEDDISPILIAEHKLNLRHVQLIEGQTELDENTTPKTVTIVIKQKQKKSFSETFNWQLSPTSE